MKHFGAVLTGDNNIVDGGDSSILTISASAGNDKIIIYNQNDAATASEYAGGVFTGDALISDTGPTGFVIVPSVAGRGATHVLGADGREVAITSLSTSVNTNLIIPVSNGTSFVDSALSVSATGTANTVTVTAAGNMTIEGNLIVNGTRTVIHSADSFVSDRYFGTNHPVDGSPYVNNQNGGFVVVRTGNGGTSTFAAAATPGSLTINDATVAAGDTMVTFSANIPAAPTTQGRVLVATSAAFTTGTQTTFLIVTAGFGTTEATFNGPIGTILPSVADGNTVHFAQATITAVADSLTGAGIRFNGTSWQAATSITNLTSSAMIDSTGNWADLTTATSGVNSVNAGAGIANVGSATAVDIDIELTTNGGLGFSAGASDNASTLQLASGEILASYLNGDNSGTGFTALGNGTANQVLTSRGNGRFQWQDGLGTVTKYAATATVASGVITVAETTHGLGGADFHVSVYEYLTSAGAQHTGSGAVTNLRYNQVLPESITIGTHSGGGGALEEGTVTITLGTAQNSNQFRVVITA